MTSTVQSSEKLSSLLAGVYGEIVQIFVFPFFDLFKKGKIGRGISCRFGQKKMARSVSVNR